MALDRFHPIVAEWFAERFGAPTAAQAGGWPAIASGRDTLIAAPTGSGKTLAGFLSAINALLLEGAANGGLPDETSVVYVSPLKALGNDIHANLVGPLAEIRERAAARGVALPEIRLAVRSGDTPAVDRARMTRRPPHILITTPESLYILLTADGSRAFLKQAKTVIVDEIHAVAQDKRGSHLTLSLERLDRLTGRRLQRIGLSATQKPIEEIGCLLTGAGGECTIVDAGHRRPWALSIEVPGAPRGPIVANDVRDAIYDRLAALAQSHRTTLVFVNTRRLAERVAHQLGQRLGESHVAAHHGSLSRRIRLDAERRLKSGELRVVVATASLELGIDIGHVDLVCHLGAPSSIAVLLQRIGRAGHSVGGVSRGVLFPFTRDEMLQCAAAVRAAQAGELDALVLPRRPLDVLAQQIVAAAAAEEIAENDLYALVTRAHAYRDLDRATFDQLVDMLAEGIARRWGRSAAYLHRDRTRGTLRGRRGARLAAITSGGAIPDTADYDVVHDPEGVLVGRVNEDFAIESMAGDVFLLGNTSWRIRRVEAGRVRVEDAHGAPPSVPFWLGESPGRTRELSAAVSMLRSEIEARLDDPGAARRWLQDETTLEAEGAAQLVQYLGDTRAALGGVPTQRWIVAERFFDEAGGMQLVLHTPFGARINRAWGFALRKRFCLTFDFELQAAATDDGIVLSLGPQHSFPLETAFHFVRQATLRDDIIQAVLPSPLFTTRWRWNAARALAVPRYQGGRRVPMPIQRMRAEDLLAAVFPDQVACQDNHAGPIIPPDHPLVNETIGNCLDEAMDSEGLRAILDEMQRGTIRTAAIETSAPSPISHEILNANPYAFLDDAPLEERRARAVALRHIDRATADGPGVLDAAAIADVETQAWPDVRSADDLHDHLLTVRLLPLEDAAPWDLFARTLVGDRRATMALWHGPDGQERRAYVACDRAAEVRQGLGDVRFEPEPPPLRSAATDADLEPSEAARLIVHGWVQCIGPFTSAGLAARLGLRAAVVEQALAALEGTGVTLRGRFTPGTTEEEWCDRRLLARIHRLTLGRLRREIDAVSPATFMRFLLRWQHVQPGAQLHGRDGVAEVVGMLQGLEVPAPAWDEHVLPARIRLYDPEDLNVLCLNGLVTWGRLSAGGPPAVGAAHGPNGGGAGANGKTNETVKRGAAAISRSAPIALLLREEMGAFVEPAGIEHADEALRGAASDVFRYLSERGASFLTDIARGIGRLPGDTESALWELVAKGLASGDGFAGLRQLIDRSDPHRRRRFLEINRPGSHGGRPARRALPSGRWAVWRPGDAALKPEERDEVVARQLLRRYGVVFRDVLARERALPPWRRLLDVYRHWEAQGEVRGGRFVAGVAGEQYALPGAVEALRAVRREADEVTDVVISAADPLNLAGILLPGERISPLSGLALVLRNGVLVDTGPYGALLASRRAAAGMGAHAAAVPAS